MPNERTSAPASRAAAIRPGVLLSGIWASPSVVAGGHELVASGEDRDSGMAMNGELACPPAAATAIAAGVRSVPAIQQPLAGAQVAAGSTDVRAGRKRAA